MQDMSDNTELTQARLRELLWYCPASGLFSWRQSAKGRKMDRPAGCTSAVGYTVIRIDKRLYQAHRLAFLYIYGRWPDGDVDHKDGTRTNNNAENLRECTRAQNLQNKRRSSTTLGRSGLLGAQWCSQVGKWYGAIQVDGKKTHLGTFETAAEAHAAYLAAKRVLHEFCTI